LKLIERLISEVFQGDKMSRHKSLLFAFILVLLTSVFSASAQDSVFTVQLPEQIAEGREVTFSIAAAIAPEQTDVLEQWNAQIARFEERYPNVTVETVFYGFSPDTFAALVAGGQLPTNFEVPFTEPQKLIQQGVAENLTPYLEALGIADIFNDAVIDIVSDEDANIYGIPIFAYAQGLNYSIPALEAAGVDVPQTWEALATTAQTLTRRDDAYAGFIFNMQGGGGGWHFTNIAYGFGADIIRDNGDGSYTATWGEGAAVEAMQFIKDLRWQYDALPYDLEANPVITLGNGQAAIAMSPGDGLGWLRLNMPEVDQTTLGFAPMPANAEGERYALSGGTARMINATATEDQKEAALVYQVWASLSEEELPASRAIFNSTQAGAGAPVMPLYKGEFQAVVDAIDAPMIVMPTENYQAFYDAVNSGEVTLVPAPSVGAQDAYSALAEVLTTVLTDENADVPTLMAESAAAFQAGVLDQLSSGE
jgi:ABC-type glycerol-3-phosphate transport system substrate-binding protein